MPPYKITYFNARGRIEVARLMFALKGQAFEDVRLTREEWQAMKEKNAPPSGQLPMMEVGGVKLSQSQAIWRFVARECGYYGKSVLDGAIIDMIVDTINEIVAQFIKVFYAKEAEVKEAEQAKLKEMAPGKLESLEALVQGDYFLSSGISMADVFLFEVGGYIKEFLESDKCKQLRKIVDNVGDNPKIKAYIETRPKTDF